MPKFDVVVVGAGFAGLYLIHELRARGYSVQCLEMGDGVGGTWYWNRYPGARCDAESLAYSYSFSPELEQQWQWSERYATQPEIRRYAEHVAERFQLNEHILFEHRVDSVRWDDEEETWTLTTANGYRVSCRWCVLATGCLSVPQLPDIPGLDAFAGERYQASLWPDNVDFSGKRVGLIGTGSSGIQAVPVIAQEAAHLTVFQRTPNYSVPAVNSALDADWVARFKQNYRAHRRHHKLGLSSGFGDLEIEPRERVPLAETAVDLTDAELAEILDDYWAKGGAFFLSAIADAMIDPASNERIAEYVRGKIRSTVNDPETAELLCPKDHPIGTKRICVDTGYYETFNRANVALVDVRADPIERITPTGLKLESGVEHAFDVLALATGFDAMTGALLNMNITGRKGQALADKWAAGPRTYLGLAIHGFPNLFIVTGPGSPSVLSNMLISIEQHVDWMIACLERMREQGHTCFEAEQAAEDAWVDHVNEVANGTLFPRGGSWYLGANVPGKPRVFMPYAGGVGVYREICDEITADNYRGFNFR